MPRSRTPFLRASMYPLPHMTCMYPPPQTTWERCDAPLKITILTCVYLNKSRLQAGVSPFSKRALHIYMHEYVRLCVCVVRVCARAHARTLLLPPSSLLLLSLLPPPSPRHTLPSEWLQVKLMCSSQPGGTGREVAQRQQIRFSARAFFFWPPACAATSSVRARSSQCVHHR